MKIKKVEVIPITFPYHTPIRHAYTTRTSGHYVIVKILTEKGIEGFGSGSVLYPRIRGGESQENVMSNIKYLASEILLGQDPLNIEKIMSQVDTVLSGSWLTKAHIDYALYDLKGKILNVPVYQLLGGLCREKVPQEWIVTLDEPEAMAKMAVKYLNAGFHSLKIKVGIDPPMGVKRFRAIREAVGPEVAMGIDMDGTYRAYDALRLIEELAQYGLNFAEQPVSWAKKCDIDGFLAIKSKTNIPLVADSSGWTVADAYNFIKNKAADIFHTAPCRIGGFRRTLKYIALIEAADLDYAISTYNATGIAHAAAAHLTVSCSKSERVTDENGNILYLCGGTETEGIKTDVTREISGKIKNGYLYPPKGPGLGIELNWDIIDKYLTPGMNKTVIQ
jgi:L-alanine-DL-glutamate epimerase-like enolase superfamily enzyme